VLLKEIQGKKAIVKAEMKPKLKLKLKVRRWWRDDGKMNR